MDQVKGLVGLELFDLAAVDGDPVLFGEKIMGIIDSCRYTLTCNRCGLTESERVLDKGSNYSGSNWGSGVKFKYFTTQWSGGGQSEPELIKAICDLCGELAEVSSRYSM